MDRFWTKVHKKGPDDCWEWTGARNSDGYGNFYFSGASDKAHRVVLKLDGIEIPPGICVCHTCDNPGCVNPDHLFFGTHADNMKDRKNKGNYTHKGETHPMAILCDEDVRRIRDMLRCGARQVDIASWFEVGPHVVAQIKSGKNWSHIH